MIYLLGNSGVVLEERDVTKIEQVQTRVRGGGGGEGWGVQISVIL